MKKYLVIALLMFNFVACNSKNEYIPEANTKVTEQVNVQEENKVEEPKEQEQPKEEPKHKVDIEEMNKKVVYLTFDDGPTRTTTLQVLDILEKNDIKATFFVIGQNPDLYNKIIEKGHTIQLHTYSHKYKEVYANEESYFADLYKLEELVKTTTGISPKIVRLPGGTSTTRVKKELKYTILKRLIKEGYVYQDWNCDSGDAHGLDVTTDEIANSIFCNMRQVNLLMHDTKESTVKSLQKIIDKYRENGYSFEVLKEDSPRFQHVRQSKLVN